MSQPTLMQVDVAPYLRTVPPRCHGLDWGLYRPLFVEWFPDRAPNPEPVRPGVDVGPVNDDPYVPPGNDDDQGENEQGGKPPKPKGTKTKGKTGKS